MVRPGIEDVITEKNMKQPLKILFHLQKLLATDEPVQNKDLSEKLGGSKQNISSKLKADVLPYVTKTF